MIRSIQHFIPKATALAVQPKEQNRLQALLRQAIYANDVTLAQNQHPPKDKASH